ncbi:hypothetical protein A3770_02p13370 [Chloropicon primus]|uniref:Uncharacterized protein n=2 Tax=Chloropicon primus TaxID=1764295 RepID=A0A5B8MEJ3_9CHLO|nr:hypothetical protein A3770_02p13370 [Chloropicon primus]|eukprot:QDZ18819.1 hypothetical protein A3770_02p13370 [Chloropicon primus]
MNTNKIFRIFAKDLQAGNDKKFVGVVETVPPNNVITLTIPTLKEAFVFSAHDPMKAFVVEEEDLCVKFMGTLTDGNGPGEQQEFLFFFSTEIKVKAFVNEADTLIKAAKVRGKGSTEKAVIRRNSLINSDGKLKTGKLLKRFSQITFDKPIMEEPAAEENEDNGPAGSDQDSGKKVVEEPQQPRPAAESSSSEEEEEIVGQPHDSPRAEESSGSAATEDEAGGAEEGTREEVSSVNTASERDRNERTGSSPASDHFLAAASILVDGRNDSTTSEEEAEQASPSLDKPPEVKTRRKAPSLDAMMKQDELRHRSSVDNTDVTEPTFFQLPDGTEGKEEELEDAAQVARTPSLDHVDVTQPNFLQLPAADNKQEGAAEDSPKTSSEEDEATFEKRVSLFLFQEKPATADADDDAENDASQGTSEGEGSEPSARLPDEYVMEESDSSEEDYSPPPIRLNRSNRRPSALRHSFVGTPGPANPEIDAVEASPGPRERGSRQSDSMITHSSRSIFLPPQEASEESIEETLARQLKQAQTDEAKPRTRAISLDAQMAEEDLEPPPLPTMSTSKSKVDRKAAAPAPAPVAAAPVAVQDGAGFDQKMRERELEFQKQMRQRDKEYQKKIDLLLQEQAKKSDYNDKRFEVLKQGFDKKEASMQQGLAEEMHEMRQGYERRIEALEKQLRSGESGRLKEIRGEYDHMRHTMQEDFERAMKSREREIRADEARKLQQLQEKYEEKVQQIAKRLKAEAQEKESGFQRRMGEEAKLREHDQKKFEVVKHGYEEQIEKLEKKYESLSKTFKALKNHELDLQNKATDKKEKAEMQKLHTILSLTWNMLSTVDSEIAHFESLELPSFDWDRHVVSIHGHEQQQKKKSKYDEVLPGIAIGHDPPPLLPSNHASNGR